MHAHWLDDETPISADALGAEGILYRSLDPDDYAAPLDALAKERGYVHQDEVALSPQTPNLDAICDKFKDEHLHTEDEVRFVRSGEGVFDIRSAADRWMRVTVEPGDLIVVPKDRYHRFFLTDQKAIQCVRLFQDTAGWEPHYRT